MSHRNRTPPQPKDGGDCKSLQWFAVQKVRTIAFTDTKPSRC